MNEKQYSILCVDDEKKILNALKRLFRKEGYHLYFANSGMEGLEILNDNDIQMVISDQRMPEMNGTEFLAEVKFRHPDVLRIILSGYSNVDAITQSINEGHIYKFFSKPWNDQELKTEIRQALEQSDLVKTSEKRDACIIKLNLELQEMNENPEEQVKTRTYDVELQNKMLQLSHAILEDLPIAVMGIDNKGSVVLTNKMAQIMIGSQGIRQGASVSEYFPKDVPGAVREVIDSGRQVNINGQTLKNKNFKAAIMPLSGRYKGRGVIMTIHP
jgi:response regulator RpfG family c-di-GMP phosphodiesterase